MTDARLASCGAFTLRVALGAMFIAHAWLKLSVFTVAGFQGFLGQVGLPAALAWPIILAELVGGLALVLGLYSRVVAVALIPILLGALAVHGPERLGLQRAERRLGVPRLPRRRGAGAGPDRRRCLRAAARLDRPPRPGPAAPRLSGLSDMQSPPRTLAAGFLLGDGLQGPPASNVAAGSEADSPTASEL